MWSWQAIIILSQMTVHTLSYEQLIVASSILGFSLAHEANTYGLWPPGLTKELWFIPNIHIAKWAWVRHFLHRVLLMKTSLVETFYSCSFVPILDCLVVWVGLSSMSRGCWWPGSKSQDSRSKAMGWPGLTFRSSRKKCTPYQQHCSDSDWLQTDWLCYVFVCVCVYMLTGYLEE